MIRVQLRLLCVCQECMLDDVCLWLLFAWQPSDWIRNEQEGCFFCINATFLTVYWYHLSPILKGSYFLLVCTTPASCHNHFVLLFFHFSHFPVYASLPRYLPRIAFYHFSPRVVTCFHQRVFFSLNVASLSFSWCSIPRLYQRSLPPPFCDIWHESIQLTHTAVLAIPNTLCTTVEYPKGRIFALFGSACLSPHTVKSWSTGDSRLGFNACVGFCPFKTRTKIAPKPIFSSLSKIAGRGDALCSRWHPSSKTITLSALLISLCSTWECSRIQMASRKAHFHFKRFQWMEVVWHRRSNCLTAW